MRTNKQKRASFRNFSLLQLAGIVNHLNYISNVSNNITVNKLISRIIEDIKELLTIIRSTKADEKSWKA